MQAFMHENKKKYMEIIWDFWFYHSFFFFFSLYIWYNINKIVR